jgi:ATP/maltotriose-dependent transcriptional regulator MalT
MCWCSLDNLDRDLQRFIAYFISAIRLRYPEFGQSSLTALYGMSQDHLDVHAMVTLIVNEIYDKITEHFILVLDDFHLVSGSRDVVHFVNQFLMDVDENCHLVLVSRSLLTLPDLTLMVARSQVGGLSFQELSFLPEEIQNLLTRNYQIHLSENEIQELARETEGWITGLLLSSQIMGKTMANQIRIARVSGVGLYEYLAQQVLAQQSQDIQNFLLWTALLDEFDENLCVNVIGAALKIEQPWRELIDVVLRGNLFVLPVGEDGSVFRYHHLFRDFLQDRIRRERPEEAKKISNRLAEIYIAQRDWDHAFEIYRFLNDQAAMVQLIQQAASHLIADGRFLTLSQWIEVVPPEDLPTYPGLVSLLGTITVLKGDTAQGIRLLDQAVDALEKAGQVKETAQTLLRRGTAHRMAGQFDLALTDVEKVFELYGPDPQIDVNYTDALFNQGILLVYLGKLKEALVLLYRAKDGCLLLQDPNTAAKAWMEIGRVSRLLGNYSDAEAAYQRSLEYFEATHNLVWQANLYNNLGVLLHSKGDYVEAITDFEKAVIYTRTTGSPRLEGYTLASIGDLYLEMDADQEAEVAYRQAQEIAQKIHDDYLIGYVNLALGKLWIHQSVPDQANILIQAAQEQFTNRSSLTEQNLVEIENGRLCMMAGQFPADSDFVICFCSADGK